MKTKKYINIIAEVLLYLIMLMQMLYVFFGNVPHEILGIAFFVCLTVHIVNKRYWFKTVFKKDRKVSKARRFADIVTLLLILAAVLMMLSGIGISRTIFSGLNFWQYPDLHRYLATAMLTLSVLHGGLHMYIRSKHKKRTVIIISLLCAASVVLGLYFVPYFNRHFKKVGINYSEKVMGEKLDIDSDKTLVVYFTRVGNTDFEPDVDAVSGASLLEADGILMGNTELMAHMLRDIGGFTIKPITLTGEKYPSSYAATVTVGGKELRDDARPAIEDIDVSGYESIILVYPLWWGTVPMPVATFLESRDFSGKTIYLLTTQGSYGFGSSISDIREMAEGADIIEGLSIYCDDIPDVRKELCNWLKEIIESIKG